MKRYFHLVMLAMLVLATLSLFLPSISFTVLDGAVDTAQSELQKQEERLVDAQQRYNEMLAAGETADRLSRQQDRVDRALANVETGKQELDKIIAAATGPKKNLSLFRSGLPEDLEVNRVIINENNNVYNETKILGQFTMLQWLALGMAVFAIVMTLFGIIKNKSFYWTLSSLGELISALAVLVLILRQSAIPVRAPYGGAEITWVGWLPLLLFLIVTGMKSVSFRGVKRTLIYILSVFLCLLSIFPFYVMIINSTRDTFQIQQGLSLLPGKAFINNWNILLGKNFNVALGLRNSAIIAFGSTILSVYFSSLCAYGLTVYEFRGRKPLFSFIVGLIMIPAQVSSIGFYMFMYRIGWVDSFLPLILPAIAAPSTVFFMRQYLMANFQISLVEASRIDGAREIFTFNKIVMPIMIPAMATMAIFSVITSWNNYLTPLMLLKKPELATLPMMIRTLRGDIYRTEFGSIYLGLALSAAPLLIVYFSLSKYIIQGVALGGVKE